MSMAFVIRAKTLPPEEWSTCILDDTLRSGDDLYKSVLDLSKKNNISLGRNNYLLVKNFNVLGKKISMFGKKFETMYEDDPSIYGNLKSGDIGQTLKQGLATLFSISNNTSGILISQSEAYGM